MSRRDELDLRDYLERIQQAIGRIQRYFYGIDCAGLLANEEKQDAVIRNLEIIGEAAGKIQRHFPGFATEHPDLSGPALHRIVTAARPGCCATSFRWRDTRPLFYPGRSRRFRGG